MKKFVCALAALALAVPLASCGQSAADKKAAESSSAPEKNPGQKLRRNPDLRQGSRARVNDLRRQLIDPR